jgi:rod shape-determining protein MreB
VDFNAAIQKYLHEVYKLNIGSRTAEYLKIQSSSSGTGENDSTVTVSGVNRLTGFPQRLLVSPREVHDVLRPLFTQISDCIKKALRQVSPELMADIVEGGIMVCGGGALLSGLRHLIEREVGIAVTSAKEPLTCLAVGLMSAQNDRRVNRARRHGLEHGFPVQGIVT